MATVIVLNGTSSSGKTRIAQSVQELAADVFLSFSIDHIPARQILAVLVTITQSP